MPTFNNKFKLTPALTLATQDKGVKNAWFIYEDKKSIITVLTRFNPQTQTFVLVDFMDNMLTISTAANVLKQIEYCEGVAGNIMYDLMIKQDEVTND